MSTETHAFERSDVAALVHTFYRDVRADELLGPLFDHAIGDDWGPHLSRMVDFWSTVFLGAHSFRGNVFGKHMDLGLRVRQEHFLRWLTLWSRATSSLFDMGIASELQDIAQRVARNLYYGFFGQFVTFVTQDGEVVDVVIDDV